MKQITGQSKASDDVVERDNKDLTDKERTTKFLKCVQANTYRTLKMLENKHPTYQPFLQHFTRVFNDFIEKYLDGYRPNYVDNLDKRNLKKEEYTAIKNNFWRDKITIQEIKNSSPAFLDDESPGQEFTDHDVKLFRYLKLKSRRILENIGQEYKLYWPISQRFALIFNDLLEALGTYYMLNYIDKLQNLSLQEKNLKTKENLEKTDKIESIGQLKRQKQMTEIEGRKVKKKYRKKKELDFPDLGSQADINKTKQQAGLRLPPKILDAVKELVHSQGIARNEWMTQAIEEKLKAEAPYLYAKEMTL